MVRAGLNWCNYIYIVVNICAGVNIYIYIYIYIYILIFENVIYSCDDKAELIIQKSL